MKEKIFTKIKEYLDTNPSVWHTPGHKGLLSRYDITEIDCSFPSNSIELAQEKAAALFGAKHLRFLTGGSSIGIKAAIMSLAGDFLVESNCHPAILEGLSLARKNFFILENHIANDLPLPITAQQIEDMLKKNRSIRSVVITSPDYYGQTANVDQIREVADRYDVLLHVDAAHGAHLSFREDLFSKSFTQVADTCNISAHKTLPAFTQSAYLCVNNTELVSSIDENLKLLGTTSPSYLLLSGLEYAVHYCQNNANHYDALYVSCMDFKKRIRCLQNDDFTRLVVDARYYNLSGSELYYRLKEKNIIAEKFDNRYVVFIVSIMDQKQDIAYLMDSVLKAVCK